MKAVWKSQKILIYQMQSTVGLLYIWLQKGHTRGILKSTLIGTNLEQDLEQI